MSLKRLFLSAIWLFVMLPPAFAFQQGESIHRRYFPKPGDYSVRLPDLEDIRHYMDVPAAIPSNSVMLTRLERIKDWQTPPDQQADPLFIQIKCRREGDAVKIDLMLPSTQHPKSNAVGNVVTFSTLPEDGYPGEIIGSYSARPGESVTFKELARFGIEPFTVKVVSSNARAGNPSEIINKTGSIEVLSVDKSRGKYLIALRNNSSKNVIAYCTSEQGLKTSHYAGTKPLIAAGETLDDIIGFNIRQRRSPPLNDDLDFPEEVKVTIAAVVFDDYSYEGDEDTALELIAYLRAMPFKR